MIYYKNILELVDLFDVFIFDAFGVFWDGIKTYQNILPTFEKLKKLNKKIVILSNTTKISSVQEEKYAKANLIKSKYYDFVITAGEYTKFLFDNNLLDFTKKRDLKTYYIFGKNNKSLFQDSNYIEVKDIEKADFIYLSSLSIMEEEYDNFSDEEKKYIYRLKSSKDGSYRIGNFDILLPKIKKIFTNNNIPCVCANPDLYAFDSVVGQDNFVKIITPGTLSKYLKNNGYEVLEIGKPLKEIYEFTLSKIECKNKNRICMIGDSLNTDIKGANNIGIKSILCIETGNTADMLRFGKDLNNLIKNEDVIVNYVIQKVAIDD